MTTAPLVLVVGPVPPPVHGAARVTEEVVANLRAAGGRVDVVDTSGTARGTGLRYHAARVRAHVRAACVIWRARRDAHAVYLGGAGGLGLWYQLAVILISRCGRLPIYFHHHSFAYLNEHSRTMALLIRVGGSRLTHVALCPGMRTRLEARYPDIGTVLVCSNAGLFAGAGGAQAAQARTELVIGHLGNLVVEKGLPLVLDTLRCLQAIVPDARLLLGGPVRSPEAATLLERAQAEFGAALEYVGAVAPADVPAFYRRLDAFVFPSSYQHEAEPMVVLEAASCGVPSVAFDVGCLPSMVPGAEWLVAQGIDFPAAATRILGGLADAATRDACRRAVLARFAEQQSAGATAHRELVSLLLGRGYTPTPAL